jgi:hypothetical protein
MFTDILDEYIDARIDFKAQQAESSPRHHGIQHTVDDDISLIRNHRENVKNRYDQARLSLNRAYRFAYNK